LATAQKPDIFIYPKDGQKEDATMELRPRISSKQTAKWIIVDNKWIRVVQQIATAYQPPDRMSDLLDRHDPARTIRCIPCENDCGKILREGERCLVITTAGKRRQRFFCSVECQRQNVVNVKTVWHRTHSE
jgi:hypothetical protein